jgi:WD40 repeat protein
MVKLYDVATRELQRILWGHAGGARCVAFRPGELVLASGGTDHTVRLWDAATGGVLTTLKGHSEQVRDVAFSPDGSILASASDDGTVKLWDVAAALSAEADEPASPIKE